MSNRSLHKLRRSHSKLRESQSINRQLSCASIQSMLIADENKESETESERSLREELPGKVKTKYA